MGEAADTGEEFSIGGTGALDLACGKELKILAEGESWTKIKGRVNIRVRREREREREKA